MQSLVATLAALAAAAAASPSHKQLSAASKSPEEYMNILGGTANLFDFSRGNVLPETQSTHVRASARALTGVAPPARRAPRASACLRTWSSRRRRAASVRTRTARGTRGRRAPTRTLPRRSRR